ncbi:MAG: hypothetical protein GY866_23815 [Proteobacteria bacterium]|nr:hypothetical protein [Pseudomonadota bacterium]
MRNTWVEDRFVYFKYRKHGSRQYKTMRLEVMEFMRRFLQHVLPPGFMKVRHCGFMNPNCASPRERIVEMIETRTGESLPVTEPSVPQRQYCPDCSGELVYLWSFIPTYNRRE